MWTPLYHPQVLLSKGMSDDKKHDKRQDHTSALYLQMGLIVTANSEQISEAGTRYFLSLLE